VRGVGERVRGVSANSSLPLLRSFFPSLQPLPRLRSGAPALLKEAAEGSKKVPAPDLVAALLALEKASRAAPAPPDASLLQGLGGAQSPGRMWRLVSHYQWEDGTCCASANKIPLYSMYIGRYYSDMSQYARGIGPCSRGWVGPSPWDPCGALSSPPIRKRYAFCPKK